MRSPHHLSKFTKPQTTIEFLIWITQLIHQLINYTPLRNINSQRSLTENGFSLEIN